MPYSTDPDELAQLRAALAAQLHSTKALQTRLARLERRRHMPRRALPLLVVTLLVGLMPLSLLAAGPTFSDMNNAAAEHRPNIQAIGDAGITTGFADPNNPNARIYDPKATVTREEMASFLARTAGLGGNPPLTNAKTLAGYAPNELVRAEADDFAGDTLPQHGSTEQGLAAVTIVAPRAGLVIASSNLDLTNSNTLQPMLVEMQLFSSGVINGQAPTAGITREAHVLLPSADNGGKASVAQQTVRTVAAGEMLTVYLSVRCQVGNGTDCGTSGTYAPGSLSAIFIPIKGDGSPY